MTATAKPQRIDVATPQVGEDEIEAVAAVLRSGQYASGPKTEEFERAFAAYVGTTGACAVSNGTSALYIALECLGVRKGDEVLVPALTFFSTVTSVVYVGAKPVFVDIDPDDLCLSPSHAATLITERTKCILPVHLFGAAAKMADITALGAKHGIPVLEDCAQSHGTTYDGKVTGSIGKVGAFSFFATKHMTTGEGGMITSSDAALVSRAKVVRSHGMTGRDDHDILGYNNRLNDIASAIGIVQLKRLDELNRRRIENSEYIIDRIRDLSWLTIPLPTDPRAGHTYFWCPLMVPGDLSGINKLKAHLDCKNIGYRHRYAAPLYKQKALKQAGLDYTGLYLPNVERIAGRVIGLPNHPGLTREELDLVVDAVRSYEP